MAKKSPKTFPSGAMWIDGDQLTAIYAAIQAATALPQSPLGSKPTPDGVEITITLQDLTALLADVAAIKSLLEGFSTETIGGCFDGTPGTRVVLTKPD